METVKGYVEHIVFRNEDNGYTVFNLNNDDGDLTCVGNFNYLSEGELVEVNGEYVVHSVYGTQLRVLNYEIKAPEDLLSIERYLGSGAIKGVGASLAGRIVKKFREDTFRIIEEEPERLAWDQRTYGKRDRCTGRREKRYAEGNDLSSEIWDFDDTCSKDLSVLRSEDLSGTGRKSIPACRSDSGDRI